jgi:hypothetical protein
MLLRICFLTHIHNGFSVIRCSPLKGCKSRLHCNLYGILIYCSALALNNSKETHADRLEIEVNVF